MRVSDLLVHWVLPFLLLLLAGVLTRLYLRQKARNKDSERIRTLQDKIKAALEEPPLTFDASLRQSLERGRTSVPAEKPASIVQQNPSRDLPEKYRILSHMVARGMSVEEIASILGISTTEAGQLVTLSNMAGCNN